MPKFTGYIVEVHRGPEVVEQFDYDVAKLQAELPIDKQWKIPFCPLAAVSITLGQGTPDEIRHRYHEFNNFQTQIRVFDPSRNETSWYDAALYERECALEKWAG